MTATADASPLLEINELRTYFGRGENTTKAVDDLSITLQRGHTLGVVGESGSGKSVTSLTVMRLLPPSARIETGTVSYLGKDLVRLPEREMQDIRGSDISMIFQEPGTSLNPVFTVGDQVIEAIRRHEKVSKEEARQRTIDLFNEVGIPEPERRIDTYPHEMSGGQKQRVMIAMALSCQPEILIADEPTTALDVTIQSQILDLIRKLRDERGMAILFITHDLGVIAEIADDVAVMYRGNLVEYGDVEQIFEHPKHPYTRGLLACRPRLGSDFRRLPTVSDFMETIIKDDGTVELIDKSPSEERLYELEHSGRGRLLHPKSELEQIGHPAEEAPGDAAFVEEGTTPILKIEDLKVHYPIRSGVFRRVTGAVKAVDGISFNVYPGQTLGLVGESGCGKTTTGRAIVGLAPVTDGAIVFEGRELHETATPAIQVKAIRTTAYLVAAVFACAFLASLLFGVLSKGASPVNGWIAVLSPYVAAAIFASFWKKYRDAFLHQLCLKAFRKRVQVIFQDPYASLNPRMTVQRALVEAMATHNVGASRRDRINRAAALLEEVGLLAEHLGRYPHEFSGGQRQRICIARALAVEPDFVICDESVSALDVSVQAQVCNLLKDLQENRGLTYIFISHDLSVVKFMSDMMAVMAPVELEDGTSGGRIVEFGPSDAIYANPREDYTKQLISAIPDGGIETVRKRVADRERRRAASEATV